MAITITLLTEGSDATLATTTTTASVTVASSAKIVMLLAAPALTASMGWTGTHVWNGATENSSGGAGTQADGTNDTCVRLVYWDTITAGTGTFTINHSNVSTRRVWQVYQITGDYDASSATAWRGSPNSEAETGGTTHETAITSEAGDIPLLALAIRNTASAPTLTLNGTSTLIDDVLGGTTQRLYFVRGTGAASVTLGGTTGSSTQSARAGFNINAAASGIILPHSRARRLVAARFE